jgi:hypothetical protein
MLGFLIPRSKTNNTGIAENVGILPNLDPLICPVHTLGMKLITMYNQNCGKTFLGEPKWKDREWSRPGQHTFIHQDPPTLHGRWNTILDGVANLTGDHARRLRAQQTHATTHAAKQQSQKLCVANNVPIQNVANNARYVAPGAGATPAAQRRHYLNGPDDRTVRALAQDDDGGGGPTSYQVPRAVHVTLTAEEERNLLPMLIPWILDARDNLQALMKERPGGIADELEVGEQLLVKRNDVLQTIVYVLKNFLTCSASRPLVSTAQPREKLYIHPGRQLVNLHSEPLWKLSKHALYTQWCVEVFAHESFQNLQARVQEAEIWYNGQQQCAKGARPPSVDPYVEQLLAQLLEAERENLRLRVDNALHGSTPPAGRYTADRAGCQYGVERGGRGASTCPGGGGGTETNICEPLQFPSVKGAPDIRRLWEFWEGSARRLETAHQLGRERRRSQPDSTKWRPFTQSQKKAYQRFGRLLEKMDDDVCESVRLNGLGGTDALVWRTFERRHLDEAPLKKFVEDQGVCNHTSWSEVWSDLAKKKQSTFDKFEGLREKQGISVWDFSLKFKSTTRDVESQVSIPSV